MKKLKYIYLLLIAMLLGFAISSCEDDDVEVAKEVAEDSLPEGSGEMISTTFTVGISAPNVSGDLDVATRAGADNANIEYAKPENGGRFQNLIVVLTNQEGIIKGVECKNWGDGVGVKEYTAIFPNIQVPATDVTNKKQYKVYAFGNICQKHYVELDDEAKSKINGSYTGWQNFDKHCISLTLTADNVYELDFTPGTTHYSKKNDKEYYVNTTKTGGKEDVVCTGMPVNNSATAMVVKGNTQFNVALKRVCARLQVTFRNFTGTYKDYDDEGIEKPNNVYVDKFEIKNVLSNKANYFCNNTTSVTDAISSNFDILQALGGSKTNDHIINKIENGKDLVVSMYVFENNKGGYQYDLKVDRGKSLGLNTTVIDTANAYVIWNNEKNNSIAYIDGEICASREQTSKDNIPFSDQVFWKLEYAPEQKVANSYMLRHLKLDKDDKIIKSDLYFAHSSENQGFAGAGRLDNDPLLNTSLTSITVYPQYVQFSNKNSNEFTMNLLNSRYSYLERAFQSSKVPYNEGYDCWGTIGIASAKRYYYLTVDKNNELCKYRSELFSGESGLKYEWTLYAKYIIKKNEAVNFNKGEKGTISKIDRNHSYELDFSVMPNYETKQELLVSCVRKQNEVSWSEVQK